MKMRRILFYNFVLLIWVNQGICQVRQVQSGANSVIQVVYENSTLNDTLELNLYSSFYFYDPVLQIKSLRNRQGCYEFSIPDKQAAGYFEVRLFRSQQSGQSNTKPLVPLFFWETTDRIRISISEKKDGKGFPPYGQYEYRFSGIGASKYKLSLSIDAISGRTENKPVFDSNFQYHDPCEASHSKALQLLEVNKRKISSAAYNVFKANIVYGNAAMRYWRINDFFRKLFSSGDKTILAKYLYAFNNSWIGRNETYNIPAKFIAQSRCFFQYTFRRLQTRLALHDGAGYSDSLYYSIKREFTGELLDNLLLYYFLTVRIEDANKLYVDAINTISSSYNIARLRDLSVTLPGFSAYNFSLQDTAGTSVSLSDFSGKVVLVDVWFTGCGGCYFLYKDAVSKVEEKFKTDSNYVFVSISIDTNREKWISSVRAGKYTSPDVVNLYTGGDGPDNPFIRHYRLYSYPTIFIIDRQGKIARYNTPDLYDEKSLSAALENLQ